MEEKIEKLADYLVKNLIQNKETIATMESCTGGLVASEITNISGASEVLKESYITYCNEAKIKCGVSKVIIEKFSVYSKETAIEMAKHAAQKAQANWGIGVTGQFGRIDPANPGSNTNEVYYAIYHNQAEIGAWKFIITQECKRVQKKQMVVVEILKRIQENIKYM